jgi:hypothetical protein
MAMTAVATEKVKTPKKTSSDMGKAPGRATRCGPAEAKLRGVGGGFERQAPKCRKWGVKRRLEG